MRNYIRPIFISAVLFFAITTYGQGVKFGDNKTVINSGSLLELESTNKGFLPPRINLTNTTTWTLLGSGVTGMQVFNTNAGITGNTSYPVLAGGTGIYYWDGNGWVGVASLSTVTSKFWGLTGNSGTNSAVNFLGTTDGSDLVFKTNNTENIRIASGSGNVGVGLAAANLGSPSYHLDVAHDIRIVSDRVNYTSARLFFEGKQVDNGVQGDGIYMLDGQANGVRREWFLGKPYGNYGSTGGNNSYLIKSVLADNMDVSLPLPGTGTVHFYIDALNNRVGIGTTTPAQRLAVAGQAVIDTLAGGALTDSIVTVNKAGAAGGLLRSISVNSLIQNNAWAITGNSGTNSGNNFLGTTDDHPLVFKVNNTLAGYIDSSASANKNTFFGLGAGATAAGGFNTFIGAAAGGGVTNGTANVYLGGSAGNGNNNGFHNLFAGYTAGASAAGAAEGTFLGYAAGLNTTGNYNTFVGSQAGQGNTLGAGSVLIGYQAGYNLTAGGNSIIIGYQAGYNNTTGQNQFIGYQAGNKNTTGNTNLFEGHQAGYNNATGFGNQFIGYQAGYTNTTGAANIFMGHQAGYSNTSGINNTFIGYLAGTNNTTGGTNHFQGLKAGYNNTTGTDNFFVGYNAGMTNTTGGGNSAIGNGADVGSNNLSNAAAIGHYAKVYSSNSLVLGDSSASLGTYAVNVGIGVRSPLKRLHIDAATPNTGSKQADSLKIDNLATGITAYNKALLVIDSTTGYVSKQGIDVLGANSFWALKGNSSTSPGTNALGAAADANFIGTKDAQNLVIGTNGIKRMIIDQSGNAYGGNANAASGTNSFVWGNTNTLTNGTASVALGDNNTISSSPGYALGSKNTVSGTNSAAIGYYQVITGANSVGIGGKYGTGTTSQQVSGAQSVAIGIANTISADQSFALGSTNIVAWGGGAIGATNNIQALGAANSNGGNYVVGEKNTTSTSYAGDIALGYNIPATAFTNNRQMVLGGFDNGYSFYAVSNGTPTSTPQVAYLKAGTNTPYLGIGSIFNSPTQGTAPYTGTSQHSTLQVSGSMAASTVAYSGTSYTLTDKDHTVILTGSSAATVTLPQASTCPGRMYVVVNMTTLATHKVQSYNGTATELVHGSTSLATPVASFTFNASGTTGTAATPGSRTIWQSDGNKWYLVQN